MTDTDRMVVWLREALDAAEQIARAACLDGAGHWQHHGYVSGADVSGDHDGYHVACDEGYPTLEQAQHIALNDPHSVLLRVAAERKMLDEHPVHVYKRLGPRCRTCGGRREDVPEELRPFLDDAGAPYPCPTVRLLAEGWGWTEETT